MSSGPVAQIFNPLKGFAVTSVTTTIPTAVSLIPIVPLPLVGGGTGPSGTIGYPSS